MLLFETGYATFLDDQSEIGAFRADLGDLFGPVAQAVARGELATAARLLVDGSTGQAGYFDRQPQAVREVQLDNAAMLPLLLAQTRPPKITAEDLAAIAVPISIVCGDSTRMAYRLASQAAMRILPGPHHWIDGAHHFWPVENPAAFCSLIRTWLDVRSADAP